MAHRLVGVSHRAKMPAPSRWRDARRRRAEGGSVRRSRSIWFTASLLALALAAGGCGGDDGDAAAPTTTAAGGVTTTPAKTGSTEATTSTTAGPQPTTLEAWEALWAKEREAIVKRIKDNGWGKSADGKTLTGP